MEKNNALQSRIIKRFMSEKDFEHFIQQYREHRSHSRFIKKPNEKDLRIVSLIQKEQSYSKVAKLIGIPNSQVMAAIGRVAASKK